jgi:hypothetical protein
MIRDLVRTARADQRVVTRIERETTLEATQEADDKVKTSRVN